MRKIILITTMIFLLGFNINKESYIIVSESDYDQAKIAFSELKEALKSEDGKLWNYKLDGPILLINRETRIIIANEPDGKGELIKQGDYYVGRFADEKNIANTAGKWNGKRWTIVALPLPGSKVERLDLLIHESFHRIQPLIGFDSLYETQNNHLDSKEGRIYLILELKALKEALISDKPENHIKNALLFRLYRQQLFPGAKASENSVEINEGLAEFTGSLLSGRTKNELLKHYISKIDKLNNVPTFVRSFPYYTIPVYGYFMRQSDEKWNLKINKKTNLTDYIIAFFKLSQVNLDKENIMTIGKSYNIDSIIEFEQNRELKQLEQIKNYKSQFLGDSIITINLIKMAIGFNPSNLMPLDSFGTVYPYLRISDKWGILEVDSCGALLSPDWDYVTITYPEMITDTLIRGKGWKLKLNEDWKLEKENSKCKYRLTKE